MSSNTKLAEMKIFSHYLPLVNRVASSLAQHRPSFMDRDDLVQDGVVGLLQAIRAIEAGYAEGQFRTYAFHRIRGAIIDNLRAHSPVSRSEYKAARGKQKAAAENSDAVSAEDLCRAEVIVTSMFVHNAVFDEEIHRLDACPGPDDYLAAVQVFGKVIDVLEKTPERQREVFIQCAIYDQPQAEIACRLKISAGRVCQIVKDVRQQLKDTIQ